jgi:hypothetical protein
MKTALGFMAFMIRFPAAKLEELLERFEALPAEEKAKVKEAFKEEELGKE